MKYLRIGDFRNGSKVFYYILGMLAIILITTIFFEDIPFYDKLRLLLTYTLALFGIYAVFRFLKYAFSE